MSGIYLVMSDTHDNLNMLGKLMDRVKGTTFDGVIHLGDLVSPFTLKYLVNKVKSPIVILGNNDGDKILLSRTYPNILDQPVELKIGNLHALLLHGFGSKDLTYKIVKALARGADYDIIMYGHTHEAKVEVINKTLVFNPGTVSGYLSDKCTYGILDLSKYVVKVIDINSGEVIIKQEVPRR